MWGRLRVRFFNWIWTGRHHDSQSPANPVREWLPVEVHAEQLVELLWHRWGAYPRAFPVIVTDYQGMCQNLGWHEHPWKTVAACLTSITTGRKVYERRLVEGRPARQRVYPVENVIKRRKTEQVGVSARTAR